MRKIISILLCAFLFPMGMIGQNSPKKYINGGFKKFTGSEVQKFDSHNILNVQNMNEFDVIRMFELAGISSYTVGLNNIQGEKKISIIIDEYKNQKKIKSDTMRIGTNTFNYFVGDTIYKDYFNFFKIYLSTKKDEALMKIIVPSMESNYIMKSCKDSIQEYRYFTRKWEYPENYDQSKRKNILTYASMWKDKDRGFYRFCGAAILKEDDEGTDLIINNSPHVFTIGYIIR